MSARNDITGDSIKTKVTTNAYRDGYDNIFNKPAIVQSCADGWSVTVKGKTYSYNHNDEDLGASVVCQMLNDLGVKAEVEEIV